MSLFSPAVVTTNYTLDHIHLSKKWSHTHFALSLVNSMTYSLAICIFTYLIAGLLSRSSHGSTACFSQTSSGSILGHNVFFADVTNDSPDFPQNSLKYPCQEQFFSLFLRTANGTVAETNTPIMTLKNISNYIGTILKHPDIISAGNNQTVSYSVYHQNTGTRRRNIPTSVN